MQIEKIITVDMSKSEIIRNGLARRLIAQISSSNPNGALENSRVMPAAGRNDFAIAEKMKASTPLTVAVCTTGAANG